ncbi:unnamed protein product [Polarella glacialis]|uniref:FAS1 domain-containing protein n=1 Tax=Polarella glacialis TaxID=89957 RepID=A0A813GV45_POLGL|nr:unnamed protein product [Polarella glacialis]CAE8629612.1 unnamed protein product [Polarella glacialis]
MPSKMSGLMLAGIAAYGTSTVYTAFTAVGGGLAGLSTGRSVSNRGTSSSSQQSSRSEPSFGTSTTGVCVLGAAAAALGVAAGRRSSGRQGEVSRAANPRKFNEQLPCSSGPFSVTVGKAGPSSFSILIAGLEKAGLTSALDGDGPFTLFAPDDKAFEAAGLTAEAVLAHPDLVTILKMHVLPGAIVAKGFKNQTVETLGGPVTMRKGVKGVMMNKAVINKADVEIANGIMHILGGVILP